MPSKWPISFTEGFILGYFLSRERKNSEEEKADGFNKVIEDGRIVHIHEESGICDQGRILI